jgi:phosphatidylserine/phosphatidylglycerophosphate/cardiolipin synthase-like enzyme
MVFKVSVTANCDDVFLAWNPGADIPGCIGFAIERNLNGKTATLENRVGFKDGVAPDPAPSTDYPFQRLAWTDHGVNRGDKVSYRITARIGTPGNLTNGPQSDWTREITLSPDYGDVEAYFNRGVVLSQFMGNLMKKNGWSVGDIKTHAQEVHDQTREFLSGELRLALLRLLDEAIANEKLTLNAALFELNDEELLAKLAQLGNRLNIVLANGAVKSKEDDENADARQKLKDVGANVIDRMCAPGFLGHNKFVVVSQNQKPEKVWTGSTNWQPTGLCTQANNGILVSNPSLAQCYLDAWNRIAAAGDAKGGALSQGNMVNPPKVHSLQDKTYAFAQFTSVPQPRPDAAEPHAIDIYWLLDLIAGARQSLLFAMFMPGAEIFNAATARGKEIFVRGVANTFPKEGTDTSKVNVNLVDNGKAGQPFHLDVVEPQGIGHAFSAWAEEVTRNQFGAIGHAIIHSKTLVIDAFGDNPTIVTGSHNFSKTASASNDENFIVISGNRPLAQAYAVNVLGLYDHYRWRKHVYDCAPSGKQPWSHLTDDPDWLKKYRASADRKALLKMLGI